jgi:hypothetical protein
VKWSLQRLLCVGLGSGSSLPLPHFFGLHADIVDLFLSAHCQCLGPHPGIGTMGSSHLKDMVQEW